jgi:hypothetical protein
MELRNLPVDILLELFKFLTPNALVAAADTCMLWSDVIKNSSQLMRRLKVQIHQDSTDVPLADGQHQNAEIEYYRHFFNPERYQGIKSTLDTYRSSLRFLDLKFIHLNSFENYVDLLASLQNLTKLRIEGCRVKNENTRGKVCLSNLRELEMKRSSLKFFDLLECEGLTKLLFSTHCAVDGDENCFGEFLSKCRNLKDMHLNGTARKFLDTSRNYEFR